jgi:hypothetical protein
MSTRSCIIVKVRKEDIGKEMKFNEALLPVPLDRWQDKDHEGKVWRDETGKNLCKPVKINDQYIGIYCHWDGYPEGVGAALKEHFKDYNSVLNLIIGGSCSHIDGENVRHYANRQGEKWGHLKPHQMKFKKDLINLFIDCWAEYAYLFDEEKGIWTYKTLMSASADIVIKRPFKELK